MSEHQKTVTKSLAHSRLKTNLRDKKQNKFFAKLGIAIGGVFVMLAAFIYIKNILDQRAQISLKISVDSSGVTGVLNIPNFSPIIFLGNSFSATRNVSKKVEFYERKIDTIFLLGGRDQNATFLDYAFNAFEVARIIRVPNSSERITDRFDTLLDNSRVVVHHAKSGEKFTYGNVTVHILYDGSMSNTKSDTRRENMMVRICVDSCIHLSPSPSDFVLRKLIKNPLILSRERTTFAVMGSARKSSNKIEADSSRVQLLKNAARAFSACEEECTGPELLGDVGDYEFYYSVNRGDANHAPDTGEWYIKQKSPFEL